MTQDEEYLRDFIQKIAEAEMGDHGKVLIFNTHLGLRLEVIGAYGNSSSTYFAVEVEEYEAIKKIKSVCTMVRYMDHCTKNRRGE